jgi:hypothetical protein
MIATSRVRELLGPSSRDLSDADLTELTRALYVLARHTVAEYRSGRRLHENSEALALTAVPESDRELVEERAAVLEFDANMTRDQATRAALYAHLRTSQECDRRRPS